MQIDWLTVVAQIVNFLILVWLLHRVLYRPLARTLDARGTEIARRLTDADTARAEAATAAADHRAALARLEADRESHLAAAEAEAQALRAEMTRAAHDEIARRRAEWAERLEAEKAAFLDRLRRRAGESFVVLARRVLAEMADSDLVDHIAHVFARRLATLEPEERAKLAQAMGRDAAPEVISSLPLSAGAQTVIADAVSRLIDTAATPVFREDPDLDCGVVLVVGSRHVGWTIGAHLDAFEDDIAALLSSPLPAGEAP